MTDLMSCISRLLESRGENVQTLFDEKATVGIEELEALKRMIVNQIVKTEGCVVALPAPAALNKNQLCQSVFDHWVSVMNKCPNRSKLSAKRKALIMQRIKDGYTLDDMFDAITGCAKSRFHMGDNSGGTLYNSLELILKDGGKLEQFRDNIAAVKGPLLAAGEQLGNRQTKDMGALEIAQDRAWAE